MKFTSSLACSIFCIVLTSCGLTPSNDGDVDKIKWEKLESSGFSLSIPDYMHVLSQDINPDAEFIYGHEIKEVYTMVIKESISDVDESFAIIGSSPYASGLAGYAEFVKDNISETASEVKNMSAIKDSKINGLDSKMFEIETKIDDLDVYYALNVIQGKDSYYQVYSWTLLERKDKYKDVLNEILISFQESVSSNQ
ncbi:MAG: hypothetical protein KAZ14_03550 [Nitrosomonas sp.]|nr:hypothetical protein [Nitrosomonas sp.]